MRTVIRDVPRALRVAAEQQLDACAACADPQCRALARPAPLDDRSTGCIRARASRRRTRTRRDRTTAASNCSMAVAVVSPPTQRGRRSGLARRAPRRADRAFEETTRRHVALVHDAAVDRDAEVRRRSASRFAAADHQQPPARLGGGSSRRSARCRARGDPARRRPPLPASATIPRRDTSRATSNRVPVHLVRPDAAEEHRIRSAPSEMLRAAPHDRPARDRCAAGRRRTRPAARPPPFQYFTSSSHSCFGGAGRRCAKARHGVADPLNRPAQVELFAPVHREDRRGLAGVGAGRVRMSASIRNAGASARAYARSCGHADGEAAGGERLRRASGDWRSGSTPQARAPRDTRPARRAAARSGS